ncbi:FtsK/SpoIIIE family DNA translocase [Alicyclobacillus kakegawensis]|uniref:FtsK/SpoIIIE family DNA translocase n=1 Tax=Alicyclobacillus kakegawensis TaxID=392012 RepID=UPI00083636E3|nr:DNA translocase FtsK [Alicyclobacillus kakegawensis]
MGKKQHRQEILRYELTGMALLSLSALALGRLGKVGQYLDIACVWIAGSWSFLLPVFVGYAAVYTMVRRTTFPWHHRHMGLLVLFITWLTGMEYSFYQNVAKFYPSGNVPLFSATITAIKQMCRLVVDPAAVDPSQVSGAGGGLVGYAFFSVAYYLFSGTGTLLVLGVGVIIGGALATGVSLVTVVRRGTDFMEQRLEGVWRGTKGYLGLLFGPDPQHPRGESRQRKKKIQDEDGSSTGRGGSRKRRRQMAAVAGGEFSEPPFTPDEAASFGDPSETDRRPVVHDFAARRRAQQDVEAAREGPVVEQVGNQIIMRYPDPPVSTLQPPPGKAAKVSPQPASRAEGDTGYPVGAPVRDENYQLPPLRLFKLPKGGKSGFSHKDAQDNARKLEMTLESFGVHAKVLEISRGPTVTRYELQPAIGVKVSRIVGLVDDIALALAARDVRIEAPVPGKSVIGIEVPNAEVAIVTLREVLEAPEFQDGDSKLALALGRDIGGAAIVGDLQKMPHLLVAGATGSGKSVCINGMIASILMKAKPHEVKLMMIDPKMVELTVYNGIPHLLAPVVTDPRKAAYALKKVVLEMENRYRAFAERGARDIERYNQMVQGEGADPLPYIVVIIDELADLMMVAPGDVEDAICRIAQMARAAGIHLIVATQRPSVDVITGLIKANIPSRIAFAVSSMADSRTILDMGGAEKLLGRGDMLYLPVGASKPVRVQGAFLSEEEIERLVAHVKRQQEAVYTVDLNQPDDIAGEAEETGNDVDDLFVDAMDLVVDTGQASVSMVQRRFRVGYSRAARIIDQMEQHGLVGPFEGSKPREVLVSKEQWVAVRESFRRR